MSCVNCGGTEYTNYYCASCIKKKEQDIGIGVTVVGVFIFFMGVGIGAWFFRYVIVNNNTIAVATIYYSPSNPKHPYHT